MSYRDVIGWQKSMTLAEGVHNYANSLPEKEKFGIASQIRRASVSIPSNIAEGYGRDSKLDYARFVNMALGSTRELQTQLELCEQFGYGATSELIKSAEEISKILIALARSLRK